MKVQVLASVVNQNVHELADRMRIETDAIFVNQCDHFAVEEFEREDCKIRVFHMAERGVGRSRNTALMRADKEICLFSDQDIIYDPGYGLLIAQEFEANPKADMILFNIQVGEERRTYYNKAWKRVHWYNCGRYGAVSFAVRRSSLLESGVTFSLLFGGGAQYSAGEDSLFLKEFMDKRYRVYASPVLIGQEKEGASTWFQGYHEKFFYDRGALYRYLYGPLARLLALRFLLAHQKKVCHEIPWRQAYQIMLDGIRMTKNSGMG
jgi:glycosyltransferase involved in cell wall biosynthesis